MRESESGFQQAVIDLAHSQGWLVAHFRPAQMRSGSWATPMQGDPGFPDIVLARDGRVIFAELKSAHGRVAPAQDRWALEIRGRYDSNEYHLWYPKDWDQIVRQLLRKKAA